MARGTQLRELINMLRAELGQSLQRSTGINSVESSKYALRNTYQWLYDDYDWPFLKIERDLSLAKGQRYCTLPGDLAFEGVDYVWTRSERDWLPVRLGIDSARYSEVSPTETRDPILLWDAYGDNQIEVWPPPASEVPLRVCGVRKFEPLLDEKDVCLLDDLMVVWWTVARSAPTAKSGSGALFIELAKSRLRKQRIRNRGAKTEPFVLGGGHRASPLRVGIDYMPERR